MSDWKSHTQAFGLDKVLKNNTQGNQTQHVEGGIRKEHKQTSFAGLLWFHKSPRT